MTMRIDDMWARFGLAASAATMLVAASPAPAQTADQDIRCLVAGNVFAQAEKDPMKKQLAMVTSIFYAGRVDARLSPAQIKAQLATQGKALTTATLPAVMTGCAKTFQDKQRALQAIGQSVAQAAPKPVAGPAKK